MISLICQRSVNLVNFQEPVRHHETNLTKESHSEMTMRKKTPAKDQVSCYLQSCCTVIRYDAVPLLFVALHEYKPKSPAFLGVSVSVLTSCVELTLSSTDRPSLNQVKFAKGFASNAHFRVVTWLIHDFIRGLEESVLLM